MLANAMDWFANQGWEAIALVIGLMTLVYASLAHRSSKEAARASQAAIMMNLRLQVEFALSKADRSLLLLQSACNANRSVWTQHEEKHRARLSPVLFGQSDELKAIALTERHGAKLLKDIRKSFDSLDELDAERVEIIVREANQTGIQIERLAHNLQEPRQLHH